jgi:hypothetical protein
MRPYAATAGLLIMLIVPDAMAQEHDHHDATATLGTVHFETSCSPSVQPAFNRAVALMHSFQFGPAMAGFRGVLANDPNCSIAYWGISLSNWSNPFANFKSPAQLAQGLKAADAGRANAPATARERAYLDAVAQLYTDSAGIAQSARLDGYEKAMAKLSADYPGDVEARIFYTLALAAAADPADKHYVKQLKAGTMLEALFVQYPDHPGLAHYIIHAYDEPELAARAAQAARRYGAIAPATPHALHMPSHTFTRMGDWKASIASNTGSAAAAHKAGQPADELHAADYMVYAYLQTAQDEAAGKLVLASAETFKRFDPGYASGAAPASAAFFAHAAIPARYCLERRDWAAAMALTLQPSPFPYDDAITIFARGLGAAHMGNSGLAEESIAGLARIRDGLTGVKDGYWPDQAEIQRLEVAAQLALAKGDGVKAMAALTRAAEMEDVTELASITPGPLLPAREMLGELLLELSQPTQAMLQFKAVLVKHPNRYWSTYGAAQAASRAGDLGAARDYSRQLLKIADTADEPRRASLLAAEAEAEAGAAAAVK